jgi:hypothetical protein
MVIRYYGAEYDPQIFLKKGLRAWYILLLARIVAWLERKIEYHVMCFISKRYGFSKETIEENKRVFAEESETRRRIGAEPDSGSAELRYKQRRKNSADAEVSMSYREARANRSSQFFARYMESGRAAAYIHGRGQKMANDESGIASVPPVNPNWKHTDGNDQSGQAS